MTNRKNSDTGTDTGSVKVDELIGFTGVCFTNGEVPIKEVTIGMKCDNSLALAVRRHNFKTNFLSDEQKNSTFSSQNHSLSLASLCVFNDKMNLFLSEKFFYLVPSHIKDSPISKEI